MHSKKDESVEVNGKTLSLTAQATWIIFAKTLAFFFGFILPLLLVRRLNREDFGLYKQVFLIVGTTLYLLPLGVGMSAYYFLPRVERKGQIIFNVLLFNTFMGLAACLALFFYPHTLAAIFNSNDMVSYAPMIGVTILLWVVASFLEIAPIANQEPRLATVFIIASQLTKTALLLTAAILYASVEALIYAAIIQGALQIIILLYYLNSRFPGFWRSFNRATLREQLAYALPFGVAAVLFRFQFELDNYFVSYMFDPATFAIYAIGCFNLPLVGILSESVGSVTIPRVSQLQKDGRNREIIQLIASMMRKLAALLFPLYIFLLVTSREFITVLFTTEYLASWPIFAINLTLIPLRVVTSGYDPIIRAYAEHRYFLIKVRALLLAFLALCLWFGTQRFGLMGAIIAMVTVNIIERMITAVKVRRILDMRDGDLKLFGDLWKLAVASVLAGVVTWIVRSTLVGARPLFVLAVCGVSFTAAYMASVLLFKIPRVTEREAIRRRLPFLNRFDFVKRAADFLL